MYYKNKRGFTLIELLVVVLIIGILAAIALPQYQKAVEKSRAAQAISLLKTLHSAQEAYFLTHGEYPTRFDELDVDFSWTGQEQWFTGSSATDTRSNGEWSAQMYKGSGAGILIGRISGPYKGAGFAIYLSDLDKPRNTLICMERLRKGVLFEKDEGEYCQKLFHGTKLPINDSLTNFLLP